MHYIMVSPACLKGQATYPGSLVGPEGCEPSPVCLNADCRSPVAQERPPRSGAAPGGLYADCAAAHAPVLARLHQTPPQGLQLCGHTPKIGLLPAAWAALACQAVEAPDTQPCRLSFEMARNSASEYSSPCRSVFSSCHCEA